MQVTDPCWRHRGGALPLSQPQVMAVINVTPDSFFDGGKLLPPGSDSPNVSVILRRARQLLRDGAAVLDVGGESTRPGAQATPAPREIDRVVPVVRALSEELPVPVSVDTRHAEVARRALAAGAHIVNDISGLADGAMLDVVASSGAGLVISHLRGEPRTMQDEVRFDDLYAEVAQELSRSVARAVAAGIERERILVDPGIGFGKTAQQSAALVVAGEALRAATGCHVLIGASRKSFLGELSGRPVEGRALGSVTAALLAAQAGARVLRVHDVAATVEALAVARGITGAARAHGSRGG